MITIHHLGVSQSDRIVWLMEELGLPYNLKWYDRGADGLMPPGFNNNVQGMFFAKLSARAAQSDGGPVAGVIKRRSLSRFGGRTIGRRR